MPATAETIGRALLDVQRRKRDLPTRAENIEAKAAARVKLRQETADADFAHGKAGHQETRFGEEADLNTARIDAAGSQAGAADARASTSAERERQLTRRSVAPGGSIIDTGDDVGKVLGTAPIPVNPNASATGGKLDFDYIPDDTAPGGFRKVLKRVQVGDSLNMKPSAAALGRAERLDKVGQIVDVLGELALKLNAGIEPNISGRIKGAWMKFEAFINANPDAQVYQDSLAGAASQLAKAFGESGRLSDQDIQRTVNMFPRPGDSEEVTRRKLAIIGILVSHGIQDGAIAGSPESLQAQAVGTQMLEEGLAYIEEGRQLGGDVQGIEGSTGGGTEDASPIVQRSPSTGQTRISIDGGLTWEVQ